MPQRAPHEPDEPALAHRAPSPGAEAVRIDAELLAERLRMYGASMGSGSLAQVVAAALLVAVLWGNLSLPRLLTWLAVLAVTLGARLGLAWRLRHRPGTAPQPSHALLRRMRLAVTASGATWGLAALLLFPGPDLQAQTFLAFVLAGMAAGSLTLTAFDFAAALSFAAFTLVPLSVRLLAAGGSASIAMTTMLLLFIAYLGLTGWRAQRNVRDAVAARTADALRAESLLENQRRLQQISAELTRKSDALQVALDSMEQGILSVGADGRTNFYNRRLVDLAELPESLLATHPTLEEIARFQLEQGHYGERFERVEESARGAFERWYGGERIPFPPSYHRRTRGGTMLEVKSRYLPGGGLVRTFSDVTAYFSAQQQLHDSQARSRKLALVASHTDNAVVITDADRAIEWVNDGFTRLSGYTLDEAVGRRVAELLRGPQTDPAALARLDEQLQREGHCAGELLHYAKGGRAYWFAVDSQAILDEAGRVVQYISIGRDVSAGKAAELALRAARDEAERASRAKSEFLSGMSHELRTPLNAILGFAQLLDTDPAHRLPERQRGYVQQILRAGAHLLNLINDVLDLARVEAGKQQISVEPVAVAPLVDECLELMRPLAQERDIRLQEHAPADWRDHVAADRTRLKQVLLNLLSNAIKYNQPGGDVRLHCIAAGDEVRIGVSDTGQGLGPEQRARLFTAFERLGAEGGPVPGAGIGLTLSRRMLELMHGSIEIDSEAGRGSTFWIRLRRADPAVPTAAPPGATPLLPAARATAAAMRQVLYIEDNPVNVLLVEAALEREPGVRLVTAPLPELGLDLARADRPDLILLDIQLPSIDGFEVLRRLRAADATRAIPVVAVSANAMPADIQRALAAGFDGYLTKPLDIEQLRTTVRRSWGERLDGATRVDDGAGV